MLKIFDNYYLDANSVCYMLKKAHVKGDGMESAMSVPTTPGWRRRCRSCEAWAPGGGRKR